jgi:DNA ligase-1
MGFIEGNGRLAGTLGSIIGGKYVNGTLTDTIHVGGGFTDAMRDDYWVNMYQYHGQVFEAEGRQLFDSGSLRHPRFLRWRDDVQPKEVIWPVP